MLPLEPLKWRRRDDGVWIATCPFLGEQTIREGSWMGKDTFSYGCAQAPTIVIAIQQIAIFREREVARCLDVARKVENATT